MGALFDHRVRLVIAACPLAEYHYDKAKMRQIIRKCFKDRESQVKRNPPFYVPMIDNSGESPAGLEFGNDRERAAEWAKRGVELAENHVNRTTIQSYYKIAMWHPHTLWKHINSTPVLFLVPERDTICPPEDQSRHFHEIPGPKRYHVQTGSGHLDMLKGDHVNKIMRIQVNFVHDVLERKIVS